MVRWINVQYFDLRLGFGSATAKSTKTAFSDVCWLSELLFHSLICKDPPDRSKIFVKLVLEGQMNSALRFPSKTSNGGESALIDDVMSQQREKRPSAQPAKLGSMLFGPIDNKIPESVYSEMNGEMIRQAELGMKG